MWLYVLSNKMVHCTYFMPVKHLFLSLYFYNTLFFIKKVNPCLVIWVDEASKMLYKFLTLTYQERISLHFPFDWKILHLYLFLYAFPYVKTIASYALILSLRLNFHTHWTVNMSIYFIFSLYTYICLFCIPYFHTAIFAINFNKYLLQSFIVRKCGRQNNKEIVACGNPFLKGF